MIRHLPTSHLIIISSSPTHDPFMMQASFQAHSQCIMKGEKLVAQMLLYDTKSHISLSFIWELKCSYRWIWVSKLYDFLQKCTNFKSSDNNQNFKNMAYLRPDTILLDHMTFIVASIYFTKTTELPLFTHVTWPQHPYFSPSHITKWSPYITPYHHIIFTYSWPLYDGSIFLSTFSVHYEEEKACSSNVFIWHNHQHRGHNQISGRKIWTGQDIIQLEGLRMVLTYYIITRWNNFKHMWIDQLFAASYFCKELRKMMLKQWKIVPLKRQNATLISLYFTESED